MIDQSTAHATPQVAIPASLIVCTRNRAEMLRDTLQSIAAGSTFPAEVVIVDQSDVPDPGKEALSRLAEWDLRYHWTQARGLCTGNNMGASRATHEVLAFMHDDVLVEKNWFARLTEALRAAGENCVVTGRVIATAPEVPGGFAPTLKVDTAAEEYRGRVGKDVLKPFNVAMYRGTFKKVGGFDTRLGPGTPFPGAEDSDLGFRLLEAGCRIVYVPEATVSHRAWRAAGEYLPLRWGYGVAQGAFYAKHLRGSDLYMLRRMARNWARRSLRFPVRLAREGIRAFGDPIYMAGNFVGAVRWMRKYGREDSEPTPLENTPDAAVHAH